ncbi:extracellular solute-binding protein [Candidatus Proelusimicrobium volucris]|uniref:extracellular solute-binding protein n=1 Tax=Candidatus Proelusimicrobium volucris TaxID=3416225 RepID=UPI003D0F7E0C
MIFWMMPDNSTLTQRMIEKFLTDFKKHNPGLSINIRVINRRTLWTKMFTLKHEIGRAGCPDIIAFPHYWTNLLIKANILQNLTELDKLLRVDNCLDPLKPFCYKKDTGDIYSYPWWMDITALHYREDHLKLITSKPEELLNTWPGFLEACARLKEYFGGQEDYYPVQNNDWRGSLSYRSALPCVWGRGADIYNEDGSVSGLGTAQFLAGIEDFIELAVKGYMPILRERSSNGAISCGKSSMMLTRRQGITMFEGKETDFKVRTLPIPKTGTEHINYMSGVNLGIVRGSVNIQPALDLIKWLTRPEKQIEYASMTEVFPALEGSFESFLLASPQRIRNYAHIIAGARTMRNHIASGTVMEVLGNIMSKAASAIVMNQYSPEILKSELKKGDEDVNNILHLYNE